MLDRETNRIGAAVIRREARCTDVEAVGDELFTLGVQLACRAGTVCPPRNETCENRVARERGGDVEQAFQPPDLAREDEDGTARLPAEVD